jgi:hypothetical protein
MGNRGLSGSIGLSFHEGDDPENTKTLEAFSRRAGVAPGGSIWREPEGGGGLGGYQEEGAAVS